MAVLLWTGSCVASDAAYSAANSEDSAATAVATAPAAIEEDGSTEPQGEAILARITQRATAFEEAYLGSFSRRTVETRIFDGDDDGKLKSTRDFVVDVWDYHGEKPLNEVRECKIDDRVEPPSKCVETRTLEPAYRLFDKDARKHYRLEYQGVESWKGQACHRVRIIPREKTARHLKGDLFFATETFRLVGMNITLADYPFGLKDLAIELEFTDQDGRPVIASGRSEAHIYVPFLIDDRSVTQFTARDQRLLEERQTPTPSEGGG